MDTLIEDFEVLPRLKQLSNNPEALGYKRSSSLIDVIPKEDIEQSIIKNGGWLSKVAQDLHIGLGSLCSLIKTDYPEFLDLIAEQRETITDLAEISLVQHIKEKNLDAIKYWLRYQGKERKWGVEEENTKQQQAVVINIENAVTQNTQNNR